MAGEYIETDDCGSFEWNPKTLRRALRLKGWRRGSVPAIEAMREIRQERDIFPPDERSGGADA